MVRGCFVAAGPGQLTIMESVMNSTNYHKVLKEDVRTSVNKLDRKWNWTVKHDKDLEHNRKSPKEWRRLKAYKISQSPDRDFIEVLKRAKENLSNVS